MGELPSDAPLVNVLDCYFWGMNPDGTGPFVYLADNGKITDEIAGFYLQGWFCVGTYFSRKSKHPWRIRLARFLLRSQAMLDKKNRPYE